MTLIKMLGLSCYCEPLTVEYYALIKHYRLLVAGTHTKALKFESLEIV